MSSPITLFQNTVSSAGPAITITHPSAQNHLPQRNLPSKVSSVQIPSPKAAICNIMRCLARLIRPLALCLLIAPHQWQRSDVRRGGQVIKKELRWSFSPLLHMTCGKVSIKMQIFHETELSRVSKGTWHRMEAKMKMVTVYGADYNLIIELQCSELDSGPALYWLWARGWWG